MKYIPWKKKLLKKSRLYCIIDKDACAKRDILNTATIALAGGADLIQFRFREDEKTKDIINLAKKLKKIVWDKKKIFIINNRVDLAKAVDADGVHIGQEDMPVNAARKILGKNKIIGLSCHSFSQAISAQKQNTDYISIGPIFKTPTKPEYAPVGLKLIRVVNRRVKKPFFAIGGINKNNIAKVKAAGADRIAVCRAVCQAEDAHMAAKLLKEKLQ